MTMPSVDSGVVTSRSMVCFSRSIEIAPVVNAGDSTRTSSVSTSSRPLKIAWPMSAESAMIRDTVDDARWNSRSDSIAACWRR